jgi:hypothetical protein
LAVLADSIAQPYILVVVPRALLEIPADFIDPSLAAVFVGPPRKLGRNPGPVLDLPAAAPY